MALFASTMAEVRAFNSEAGFHFFERSTMRFFKSRIESALSKRNLFITSEQAPSGKRRYTVRQYLPSTHHIKTLGKFMAYPDKETASYALRYASIPEEEHNPNAIGGMNTSDVPVNLNVR